jgi:hypothetical protein
MQLGGKGNSFLPINKTGNFAKLLYPAANYIGPFVTRFKKWGDMRKGKHPPV